MMSTGLFLMMILLSPAQEIRVTSQVVPERVYYGQVATMVVVVENVEDPAVPEIDASDDVEIAYQGRENQSSHVTRIINGVQTDESTLRFVFRYQVTPRASGVLTLPAARLDHDGQTYRTAEVRLVVVAPEKQDRVVLEIDVGKGTYSIEEPFDVALHLYVERLPSPYETTEPFIKGRWPRLEIPWVGEKDGFRTEEAPEYLGRHLQQGRETGFRINEFTVRGSIFDFGFGERDNYARFGLERSEVRRVGSDGMERSYYRYTLRKSFLPLHAGRYTFGPASLLGTVAIDVDTKQNVYVTHSFYVVADPAEVTVLGLPDEGRPPTFTGAIGEFTLEATAAPTKVRVGDPITLTLTVRGEGLLDRIGPPDLEVQEAITKDFKVYEDASAGTVGEGAKTFTISIRPKHDGIPEIPPVELGYYSVKERAYRTVVSERIPIDVEPAEVLTESEIESAPAGRTRRELRETGKGIFANHTGLDALEDRPARPPTGLVVAGVACPAIYFLILGAVTWHRRRHGDPARMRARRASGEARRRLREAPDLQGVARAVLGYVAEKRDLPAAGITTGDVEGVLQEAGVPEETFRRLREVLERCEEGVFGKGVGGGLEALREEAAGVIRDLEEHLRR